MNNIKTIDNKPKFQYNCQRCMACIVYCPKKAIRFNRKVLAELKYFQSVIPAKEMINFINEK